MNVSFVCAAASAIGATFADEVADLISVTDWTDYQAGVFIGAATGAFCPQFEYEIG